MGIVECADCRMSNSLYGDVATSYSDNKLLHIETVPDRYLLLCRKCDQYWEMTWENPYRQDYGRTTLKKHPVSDLMNRWPTHLLLQPERIREWSNQIAKNFDFLLEKDFSFHRVAIPLSDFSQQKATYVKSKNSIVITLQDGWAEVILFLSVVPPGNGFRLSQILKHLGLLQEEIKSLDKDSGLSILGKLLDATGTRFINCLVRCHSKN